MDMYKKFCKDCIQGKIGYKCDFHILDSSSKSNGDNNNNNNGKVVDVSIVSPTQAAVDQARSELRHEMYINEPTSSEHIQSGGNSYRRQINKKIKLKPQTAKRKREVNNKKRVEQRTKKKSKAEGKSIKVKSYKSLWM